jgi:hypothetical protein
MQLIEASHGLCSVMSSEPGHSMLYKKKTMPPMVTLEINLCIHGHHCNVLDVRKYLCEPVPLSMSEVRLIERLGYCGP